MSASCLGRTANLACAVALALVALAFATHRLSVVRVAGGSMQPALWPNDLCIVTPVAQPKVSDVVLLAEPGHVGRVLHRVRSVEATSLTTQGDANPVPDRLPLPRSAVIGRVTHVLPVGRYVRRWQVALGR